MSVYFHPKSQDHLVRQLFNLIPGGDESSNIFNLPVHPSAGTPSMFQPKFDLREIGDSYELKGDFSGFKKEDLSIEWADDENLIISGHINQHSEHSNADEHKKSASSPTTAAAPRSASPSSSNYKKPTAEDEPSEDGVVINKPDASSASDSKNTTVAKTDSNNKKQVSRPKYRYHFVERHHGSFRRVFNFPGRVDPSSLKASLADGVLTVTIKMAQAVAPRKIAIE